MKSFGVPRSGQAWGMDRAREWRSPVAVFETQRFPPWAEVAMPHRYWPHLRLYSYQESKEAARSTNVSSHAHHSQRRVSHFRPYREDTSALSTISHTWLVTPRLHHGVDTLRYPARSGGIASFSSFESATYLMKCPRRRAELDTKHKSQPYGEIGQWHTWELPRSISHRPTSPPRICRNRVAHCRLTSGHGVSSRASGGCK